MPQICSICRHPKRAEIDQALIRADTFRNIAAQHGVSTGALQRHRNEHIAAQLTEAREESDAAAASALVKELRELTRKTGEVLARALREKDGELALKAIARLERQLELKGRLLGQLEEKSPGQTTVQVVYIDKQVTLSASDSRRNAGESRLIEPAGEGSR